MSEVYSQDALVLNAAYIFISVLFCAFVAGGALFGIKEYILLVRFHQNNSATSMRVRDADWDELSAEKSQSPEVITKPTGDLVEEGTSNYLLSCPSHYMETDSLSHIQTRVSRLDFFDEDSPPLLLQTAPNMTYSFHELHHIRRVEAKRESSLFARDSSGRKQVKLSALVRILSHMPQLFFATVRTAEKEVEEIVHQIRGSGDITSKAIALVRFVAMGALNTIFDNVNFFLLSFLNFIEDLVDSGSLFQPQQNPRLHKLLVDVVASYCWAQWAYHSYRGEQITEQFLQPHGNKISRQFLQWGVLPVVVSRATVFRLMCNLELGVALATTMGKRRRLECAFKVQVLLKQSVGEATCEDCMSMVPILGHAIALASSTSSKLLFYELLRLLLVLHGLCCMNEYELSSELREVFAKEPDRRVQKKAHEVAQEIRERRRREKGEI